MTPQHYRSIKEVDGWSLIYFILLPVQVYNKLTQFFTNTQNIEKDVDSAGFCGRLIQ